MFVRYDVLTSAAVALFLHWYRPQVKTTQPRRYLVRPNQGLIAPNGSETISIMVVDKEKQVLLQSYDRLGQSALDHSKDKFLVQSCAVSSQFSSKYLEAKTKNGSPDTNKEMTEALTTMWNSVTSGGSETPVYNKKLHVRHTVTGDVVNSSNAAAMTPTRKGMPSPVKPHELSLAAMENMSAEQMFAELSSLRRKYDELVSFSVNLTAERDILNNTLEQTKRDLNREMASRVALENKGGGGAGSGARRNTSGATSSSSKSLFSLLFQLLVVAVACFLAGVRSSHLHHVDFLQTVPVVSQFVFPVSNDNLTKKGKRHAKK